MLSSIVLMIFKTVYFNYFYFFYHKWIIIKKIYYKEFRLGSLLNIWDEPCFLRNKLSFRLYWKLFSLFFFNDFSCYSSILQIDHFDSLVKLNFPFFILFIYLGILCFNLWNSLEISLTLSFFISSFSKTILWYDCLRILIA
jgi:hypothetical protein